ncbi:TRAP transporter small permease [Marinobacterium rhizophilum]|uniref:TRAP transporter small permease n=1 Tax=Marinobacterium rhizophilum TaxID=420402 RepID=UPI003B84A176
MVVVALWQVASRYVFGSPSTLSEEFLRFALIWISIMGAAYVAGKSQHVSMSLFVDLLPLSGQLKWGMALQMIFLLFAVFILIMGGGHAVSISMTQISPVLQIPMGLIYSALPVSGVVIVLYSLINIFDLYRTYRVHEV